MPARRHAAQRRAVLTETLHCLLQFSLDTRLHCSRRCATAPRRHDFLPARQHASQHCLRFDLNCLPVLSSSLSGCCATTAGTTCWPPAGTPHSAVKLYRPSEGQSPGTLQFAFGENAYAVASASMSREE